jgi:two-component sensor histidine kinase
MATLISPRPQYRGTPIAFKGFLIFAPIVIVGVFFYYTQQVIDRLRTDAQRIVNTSAVLWQWAGSEATSGQETSVVFDEVIKKSSFPIVVADANKVPLYWRNLQGVADTASDPAVRELVAERIVGMEEEKGAIPITYQGHVINYLFYDDPPLVSRLRWIPLIEVVLVTVFVAVGFFGFRNIKQSEQNYIWVGMAKEAAHQLGTPISSLLGWLQLLREGSDVSPREVADRMQSDITRLQRVANRFGQIGSVPDRRATDLVSLCEEVLYYYRQRLPLSGKGVTLEGEFEEVPDVWLNPELFGWVIENLVKNALEAVDPKSGRIVLKCGRAQGDLVKVTLSDNGKGIPGPAVRHIFRPGFSTKTRGWGLGLTLSRRIVEEYHGGKIWVEHSSPGAGTTFALTVPVRG